MKFGAAAMEKAWEQKPREFEKWAEDEGPTESEIVDAIRILTALGSCWLDRDVEKRGIDGDQRSKLVAVIKLLRDAADDQRKHVENLHAIIYRDRVAVALGAKVEIVEGGMTVARKNKRAHLANFVPVDPEADRVEISGPRNGPESKGNLSVEEIVEKSIREGFYEWNLAVGRSPDVDGSEPIDGSPTSKDFKRAAKFGMSLRKKKAGEAAKATPVEAANRIVSDFVKFDRDRWGEDISDGAVSQRFNRALNARHLDRGIWGKTIHDTGNYFGATTTARPDEPQFRLDDAAERACLEPSVIEIIHKKLANFFGEGSMNEPSSDLIREVVEELETHLQKVKAYDPALASSHQSPRAWAAATLSAKVWAADAQIAKTLFHSIPDPSLGYVHPYSWKAFATGCAARQQLHVSEEDPLDAAMARFRRGLPYQWPADLPELEPAEKQHVAEKLGAHESAVRSGWELSCALLLEKYGESAVADQPARRTGVLAILKAAYLMNVCQWQDPVNLAQLGLLSAVESLALPSERQGIEGIQWSWVVAVEAVILLVELNFWRPSLGEAVGEILQAGDVS